MEREQPIKDTLLLNAIRFIPQNLRRQSCCRFARIIFFQNFEPSKTKHEMFAALD